MSLERGNISPLTDVKTDELIGEVIRSKDKVLPLFVSPGHRCDQATATRLTLACLRGYKLPECHADAGSMLSPRNERFSCLCTALPCGFMSC